MGPFCAACGQKDLPLNPAFHEFLHDATHELLHIDGKIFRTLRKLFASPGFLTREQFEGRRARWISPIRLYLIFSLLYFAVAAAHPRLQVVVSEGDKRHTEEAAQRLGFRSIDELSEAVNRTFLTWAPRTMFLLLPLFAWLVSLAYRSTGRHYLQHLYFALHAHAAWFAVGAIAAAARLVAPGPVGNSLYTLAFLYAPIYTVRAFRVAYGGTLAQTLRRAAFVFPAYGIVLIVALLGIVLPAAFGRILWR